MNRFQFDEHPKCPNVVYEKGSVRLSLLTPCLLRLEKGKPMDLPTQTVWNRDLGDFTWE